MSDCVVVEEHWPLGVVTINRPDVRNAMSREVLQKLKESVKRLSRQDGLRALVITGAGDKAFSAGADLKERQGMTKEETLAFVAELQETFQEIAELPMPTIAAMNGDAFGGGMELALACDIRVLAVDATVGLTECAFGITPGAGGTQRLPRLVGFSGAADLIFGARRVKAEEALTLGLVDYLAQGAQDARDMALKLAESIAANAPLAVRAAKLALRASQELSMKEGLARELASYHKIIDTEDRLEGLMAFQEGRPPQFRGR